ncbi:uncharacterized protein UTRI_00963 [Ustilago trichophora]|uniref:Uncharacterized protein n=1 Tax=Ustilago trichophora TaxID=86804 RepID=A0A5C3DVD9_9BASI|nr:uncharacterized protein UTRI_00963 [Ustilago trichophora]
MHNLSPSRSGHKPRLCRCEDCGEDGRVFSYEQWRWHQTKAQRCTASIASRAVESRAVSATAAAAATLASPPASSPIALPPSPAQLAQSEPDPQAERWKRQRLGDSTSAEADPDDALLACHSDNGEADQEAKDSDANNSDTMPPFPDLPDASSSIDDQDIGSIDATDAATDAASVSTEDTSSVFSQASRLSLVHALLLDSTAGQPNNTSDSVEETITDSLQQQRGQFVMVNYIFVMYLMTFHGLSNAIATLYLSFALHVLSRFCAFVVDADAFTRTAPPHLSPPQPPSQPSPPPPASVHRAPNSPSSSSQMLPPPLPLPPLPMLVTPASVRQRLGMHSDFEEYLVCAHCGELTLWNGGTDAPNTRHIRCACGARLLHDHNRRPIQLYCHRTLESILSSMLMDKKYYSTLKDWLRVVEEAQPSPSLSSAPNTNRRANTNITDCDSCSGDEVDQRLYGEIPTGSAWLEDCSSSAQDCRRRCHHGHAPFVAAGLNLKVTLSVDWFGPHKGKFHGWHSTGAILLRIDNLPAQLTTHDRRCLGVHLVGLLPGPKDTAAVQLQKFLKLIVDELKDFASDGKVIKTVGHPEGELVKARLHLVVADTPARAKVAGFALKYRKGTICAYCPKQGEKLGLTDDEEDEEDSFVGSQRRRTRSRTAAGFRRVAIDKLSYFSAVDSCPPDMMHAIHLGLCKRFWHRLLIESCNEIGKRLPEAQSIIANALLPSNVQRPNKLIGSRSGGNPTAEQWETLFRVLLPFVLMQLWSESLGGRDDEELNFALVKPGGPRTRPLAPQSASQAANPTVHISTTTANTSSVVDATAATAAATPSSLPPPLTSHQNSSSTSSLVDNVEYQPPPGADVNVHLYEEELDVCDAPARADGEPNGRRYLPGPKRVRSVFRSAMLLCAIVELTSGDLTSAEVDKLADLIDKFNHSQAKLLGAAWLTFNNHNVTHLPYFIKRFGSPRHFSSLPFERFNGLMGTIPTSGHKGSVLEATIMRNAAQRSELRRLLSTSGIPFFETRLLQSIEGHHPLNLSSLDTRLKKTQLDNTTFGLLLDHLNHRSNALSCTDATKQPADVAAMPRYTPYWDTMAPSSVARLDTRAEFTRTAIMSRAPDAVKVGGIGQGGRDNRTNCWCLVLINGKPRAARILWIFSKAIRLSATALDTVTQTFMHVRLLAEVSLDVLGSHHPSLELIGDMGISLAIDNGGDYGEEAVLDIESFACQLAVVPFAANGRQLLGLKKLAFRTFNLQLSLLVDIFRLLSPLLPIIISYLLSSSSSSPHHQALLLVSLLPAASYPLAAKSRSPANGLFRTTSSVRRLLLLNSSAPPLLRYYFCATSFNMPVIAMPGLRCRKQILPMHVVAQPNYPATVAKHVAKTFWQALCTQVVKFWKELKFTHDLYPPTVGFVHVPSQFGIAVSLHPSDAILPTPYIGALVSHPVFGGYNISIVVQKRQYDD